MDNIEVLYNKIMSGDINQIKDVNIQLLLSESARNLIDKQKAGWNNYDIKIADLILKISNIAYNNTSLDVLPLDDGVYDQLLVIYSSYNPNYQVGATPVEFEEVAQNQLDDMNETIIATCIPKEKIDSKLYINTICEQHTQCTLPTTTFVMKVRDPITKRIINTKHSYPELVGTLDKCKFVLNADAINKGVFDKQSVQVFERDFIQKHLFSGIINPVEEFEMVCELKYDGVSVEAEVLGDTIISARSRGDTGEDIATDLTPIFGGYKFPNAKNVASDVKFGIKFEAVITKHNLQRLSELRGKSYKNCRNAIIGLLGASDSYKYIDFITLIPLSTSMDIPRVTELMFLNKYYNSGEYNRYVVINGDYRTILFKVKQFVESAEIARTVLPYLIDGVVVSYTDPNKIKALGRVNSANKYSMAIKFNAKKVRTIFLGYTFSIGKTGDVIPMVHFKACEFMGNIQTKQTLHSYARYSELQLRKGDQIDVEFVNDVLTYITKPDTEINRNNTSREPEPFINTCPYCGSKIVISDSAKTAKCTNPNCSERIVMKMVDMLSCLDFKDFSEQSVRAINIKSFRELMNITIDRVSVLGDISSMNFMSRLNELKTKEIADYKIMSALNFDNIGVEKWKIILNKLSIKEIVELPYNDLFHKLINIPKIAEKTANLICNDREYYKDDLLVILSMNNVISSKGVEALPKIAFTGERDKAFMELLNKNGFDASEKNSLTKSSYCLVTNDLNSTSDKMMKAKKFGIPIYTKQQLLEQLNIKI